jgi:hypothetical protein
MTEPETKTNTATAWGVEYADGAIDWCGSYLVAQEVFERDTNLALRYPEDDVMPVAMLKREVTTTLTITREVADA